MSEARAVDIGAVGVHVPVAGSKISAVLVDAKPGDPCEPPPTTSTRPSSRTVAVAWVRGALIVPAETHVPVSGK